MEEIFAEFENVEEIKFTRVGKDIFSVSINSKKSKFEATYCKINPTLELKLCKQYSDIELGDGALLKSESFSIPINIEILLDNKIQQLFKIETKSQFY